MMNEMHKISVIRATGLLSSVDVEWKLKEGVNILSGHNGSGKSTLLRAVALRILSGKQPDNEIIRSVDVEGVGGKEIGGSDILVLGRDFKMGFDASGSAKSSFSQEDLDCFFDIVDDLLENSRKQVDRASVELCSFRLQDLNFVLSLRDGREVDVAFDYLSSGERLAISMFASILERPNASVLILDEPEISLSMEWQKILIESILELRPALQILLATHSPAIVLRGWVDCVSEIDDLVV